MVAERHGQDAAMQVGIRGIWGNLPPIISNYLPKNRR
ncbi:hypothetical protein SEEC0006_19756 [Salmonella enterica subsp. enterica serovar Choleraesuis str. 0006]|nr:hypothetical protein SEEC0006_19756 [Salmonella enterica subsp. enterica serovar Choleraesuis str. 0006]